MTARVPLKDRCLISYKMRVTGWRHAITGFCLYSAAPSSHGVRIGIIHVCVAFDQGALKGAERFRKCVGIPLVHGYSDRLGRD